MLPRDLLSRAFSPTTGLSAGPSTTVERRLSDLAGCFADSAAYSASLTKGDPVVYSVTSVEAADGPGDLHYGLGVLMPGRIGDEYYLTKGHLHSWREAGEVYVGLSGEGGLILEDERSGESRLIPLGAGLLAYVPAHAAHRTVNTGADPLVYLGVYPAAAGHDYMAIAENNFRKVVIAGDSGAVLRDRTAF